VSTELLASRPILLGNSLHGLRSARVVG